MTSTEPTNTTLESDLASTGLCADCLKGFSFTGTPKGKTIQLSKFDTVYVASNEESKGKPAILMLTDVFGFALVNPKLIADELHEHTGFAVYVPDLFNGKPLAADAIEIVETPEEERARGVWDKIKFGLSVAPIVPWFVRNRPASKLEPLKALIQELKGAEYGHTQIGTIGYCYGGKLGAMLNIDGTSDATVFAHPSMLDKADLDKLKTPTRFLLAELDGQMDDNMVAYAKSATQKSGTVAEFTNYPGTCHGFASRGNLSNENIRKAFEGHVIESVAWFKKYLS